MGLPLAERPVSYRFCREILDAAGHPTMAVQYMAVALGLKPLLDDWVPKPRLKAYLAACRRDRKSTRLNSSH